MDPKFAQGLYRETWEVKVRKKSEEAQLGMGVSKEGDDLLVGEIKEGLIQDWNKEHAFRDVTLGDLILSVDGVKAHASHTQVR